MALTSNDGQTAADMLGSAAGLGVPWLSCDTAAAAVILAGLSGWTFGVAAFGFRGRENPRNQWRRCWASNTTGEDAGAQLRGGRALNGMGPPVRAMDAGSAFQGFSTWGSMFYLTCRGSLV